MLRSTSEQRLSGRRSLSATDNDLIGLDIIGGVENSLRWWMKYLERFGRNSRLTKTCQGFRHSWALFGRNIGRLSGVVVVTIGVSDSCR